MDLDLIWVYLNSRIEKYGVSDEKVKSAFDHNWPCEIRDIDKPFVQELIMAKCGLTPSKILDFCKHSIAIKGSPACQDGVLD